MLNIKTRKHGLLESKLSALEGVSHVETLSSQQYKLTIDDDEDVIESVAREVMNSGLGLLELAPAHANLEDVFLKLTYGQNIR